MNQTQAKQKLKSKKNIFLTGEAGTGKSYLLREYIKEMKEEGKNVLVCAPTGIAALNVGGITAHQAFGIPIPSYNVPGYKIQLSKAKPARDADIIIIDEISMCRADDFEYIWLVLKKIKKDDKKEQKIILTGDFFQLPPVMKDDDKKRFPRYGLPSKGYAFMTNAWKEMKLECVMLDEVIRQEDKAFSALLKNLREGKKTAIKKLNEYVCKEIPDDVISICSTNAAASEINQLKLDAIDQSLTAYNAKRQGRCAKEYTADEILLLKPTCRVMIIANDIINGKYVNGTMGTVVECKPNSVITKLDNGSTVEIFPHKWSTKSAYGNHKEIGSFTQIPLKCGYAVTMHKTQGQTYEKAYIKPETFADGQLYVALSRIKSIDGLFLANEILPEYVKASNDVIRFYKTFEWNVSEAMTKKRHEIERKKKPKPRKKQTTTKKTTKKTSTIKKKSTTKTRTTTKKKTTTRKPATKRTTKKTTSRKRTTKKK